MHPPNGTTTQNPTISRSIEFDAPDLPWLFSGKPDSGPIQPWIALAVIDVTDLKTDPLSASPVGTQLTIAALQLPDPAEAWMWAHGQFSARRCRAGRSRAVAVASRLLEASRERTAATSPASCRSSPRARRRARHGSGRCRAHEHGSRVGSVARRRDPAGLLLLAIRHRARMAISSRSSGGCTAFRCRSGTRQAAVCCSTTR